MCSCALSCVRTSSTTSGIIRWYSTVSAETRSRGSATSSARRISWTARSTTSGWSRRSSNSTSEVSLSLPAVSCRFRRWRWPTGLDNTRRGCGSGIAEATRSGRPGLSLSPKSRRSAGRMSHHFSVPRRGSSSSTLLYGRFYDRCFSRRPWTSSSRTGRARLNPLQAAMDRSTTSLLLTNTCLAASSPSFGDPQFL